MQRSWSILWRFGLGFLFACPALADPKLGEVEEKQIMIPMRDGKKLSSWCYFPMEQSGPLPVIFEQRYASVRSDSAREAAARLARRGYVVALVNYRGTHDSEGTWIGYRAMQWGPLRDGFDTCEWFAKQEWCNGKIGTFGSSQGGYAQNYLAVTRPPHLVCQYMIDTGLSLYHEGYRIGGTTRPERFKGLRNACRNPADNDALLKEWFQHPTYDDYWKAEDCTLHFDNMNVPCFTVGSWFDFMNQGSIASFMGRQHKGGPHSRGRQWLAIGPWLHGRSNKGHVVGELTFPKRAAWPVEDHMIKWFDHWLKQKPEAAEVVAAPPVRYFVMGSGDERQSTGNVWRSLGDWPPPGIQETNFYFATNGRLTTSQVETDSSTSFRSDPNNPMRIPGRAFPGARDARKFEAQSDVITFTTDPLKNPVEWTGRIFADLSVSSTAPDTDLIVRVSDVYPDGRSILLVDYPWRLRYREGFEKEVMMEPGKIYPVKFPVGWISQIFQRNHRIRVTIASTGAPLYEPNPQTGETLTIDFPPKARVATNSIHHGKTYPSRIIAPVLQKIPPPTRFLAPIAAKIEPHEKRVYKKIGKRELEMHIFHPPGFDSRKDHRPVFVIIHGGGWTGGTPRKFFPTAQHFAKLGLVGISLQYRLRDPTQATTVFDCVKDGRSAIRYLRLHAPQMGIAPNKITVCGGSAGGHVAVGTALFPKINEAGDNLEISPRPDALLLLNPVIDTSEKGYGQTKIGDRWKELSPVDHVTRDLPPTLIFHSTGDQVVPFEGAKRFTELSKKAGNDCRLVTYEGGPHGYFIFDEKLYDAVVGKMEKFLREQGFLE